MAVARSIGANNCRRPQQCPKQISIVTAEIPTNSRLAKPVQNYTSIDNFSPHRDGCKGAALHLCNTKYSVANLHFRWRVHETTTLLGNSHQDHTSSARHTKDIRRIQLVDPSTMSCIVCSSSWLSGRRWVSYRLLKLLIRRDQFCKRFVHNFGTSAFPPSCKLLQLLNGSLLLAIRSLSPKWCKVDEVERLMSHNSSSSCQ